jgi:hypothetical protein
VVNLVIVLLALPLVLTTHVGTSSDSVYSSEGWKLVACWEDS